MSPHDELMSKLLEFRNYLRGYADEFLSYSEEYEILSLIDRLGIKCNNLVDKPKKERLQGADHNAVKGTTKK